MSKHICSFKARNGNILPSYPMELIALLSLSIHLAWLHQVRLQVQELVGSLIAPNLLEQHHALVQGGTGKLDIKWPSSPKTLYLASTSEEIRISTDCD
jgi:hypothetical protein